MISFIDGNIFSRMARVLVNPVPCDGTMDRGLSLQFKIKYPDMCDKYKMHCLQKTLCPGVLYIYHTQKEFPKYIVNFPVKIHWNDKSTLKIIEKGLDGLTKWLNDNSISNIIIPPLGCGADQLLWSDVKILMMNKLSQIHTTDIKVIIPYSEY